MGLGMAHFALEDDESIGIAIHQLFERPFQTSSNDPRSDSRVQPSIAQSTRSALESKVTTLKGLVRPRNTYARNGRQLSRPMRLQSAMAFLPMKSINDILTDFYFIFPTIYISL